MIWRGLLIVVLALITLAGTFVFVGIPDVSTMLKERAFMSGLTPGRSRASIVAAEQKIEADETIAVGRFRADKDRSNSLDVSFLTWNRLCLSTGDDIIMTFTPGNKLVSWKRGDAADGC